MSLPSALPPVTQARQKVESVADFLKRGGRIERLPGIQKSNVHAKRRPVFAYGARSNG